MSNNKRPALSPPPGKPAPRSPPFAGAEPALSSVSEDIVDFEVDESSSSLKEAAKAFNKTPALLTQQQELLESAPRSAASGGIFDSFLKSLKVLKFICNRYTPARLKALNPVYTSQSNPVNTSLPQPIASTKPCPPPPLSTDIVPTTAHLPSRSYDSYARASTKSDRLSVAKIVATALPTSSPAEVISSASRITTSPRPQKLKALRAPKGLSFSVTLRLSSLISPDTLPVEHNFETGCKTFDLSLHEPSGLSSWYDAAQFGALDSLNWISLHVLC